MTPNRCIACVALTAALAAPVFLHAQAAPPEPDRIPSDPAFLPFHGQFYSVTGVNYESDNTSQLTFGGSSTASGHVDTEVVHQTLVYGLTDALSVDVEGEYAWSQLTVRRVGGAARAFDADGFEDPSFGLNYRLLDQPAYPLILDLSAAYSPNFVGARAVAASGAGNESRGGDAWIFQMSAAHAAPLYTVRAYVGLDRFGQSTDTDDQGVVSATSAYWRPDLGVASQVRFTDRFSLNVGGEYDFSQSDTLSQGSPLVAGAEHRGGLGDLTAGLNYHFVPDRVVGTLAYTHTFYAPNDVSFAAIPANDYSEHHSEDTVGVSLEYVFR